MATAWRIEQAARTSESKPAPPQFVDDALLTAYVAAPVASEEERREAALWVADYFAASHGCTRTKRRRCTKPEHARDVAEAREWLAVFGLLVEDEPAPPVEVVEPAPEQPRRAAPDVTWMDRAGCRGEDLMLFFGADGERPPERDYRERKAKAICAQCPVRSACLIHAFDHPERSGTWGGLGEEDRASARRRRMRRQANAAAKTRDLAAQARDLELLRRSEYLVASGETVKSAARLMGISDTSLRAARQRAQARLADAS